MLKSMFNNLKIKSYVVFILIFFTAICKAEIVFNEDFVQKPFERESWLKGDFKLRGEMAEDLLMRHELTFGKSIEELMLILGKPTKIKNGSIHYYVDFGFLDNGKPIPYVIEIKMKDGVGYSTSLGPLEPCT